MSVASEIARIKEARSTLVSKMKSAGYEVTPTMNLNALIDAIILKNLDASNLLPDTDTWSMYNNAIPDVWGNYRFEATFRDVWGGFYCYFKADLIEYLKGERVLVSVNRLVGKTSKIELVVDSKLVGTIWPTETQRTFAYTFPDTFTSAYLRAVIYGSEDMHCYFEGIAMWLV